MISSNTAVTGRTSLFHEVSIYDHEEDQWVVWLPCERACEVSADVLLQSAIDAGHDDIRLLVHVSGATGE